ncbi:MAG: hypothetical protein N2690_07160 [Rhodocyclaceae bacterium]|nr:hypothetical protein [Rhodocyclaceae bacterium]
MHTYTVKLLGRTPTTLRIVAAHACDALCIAMRLAAALPEPTRIVVHP